MWPRPASYTIQQGPGFLPTTFLINRLRQKASSVTAFVVPLGNQPRVEWNEPRPLEPQSGHHPAVRTFARTIAERRFRRRFYWRPRIRPLTRGTLPVLSISITWKPLQAPTVFSAGRSRPSRISDCRQS
ncbi:MAG: hypothetical protein MI923_25810 [Phycisphaerales bacterium]|nr:hypothetical protein [Phycisphaerales bacterium]